MRKLKLHIAGLVMLFLGASASVGRAQSFVDPGEKIFAHFSETSVISGELLWFSLFVTDAQHHRPSVLSRIAYAELLDAADKPMLQDKILIENGSGFGSFYIPASVPSGVYVFRAYTSWMKNSDPEFYFHHEIRIINTLRTPEPVSVSVAPSSTIAFFPEGGNLVNGITSRVGFQIKDQYGKGIEGRGFLLAGKDTVAYLRSAFNGLGDFYFRPQKEITYSVILKDTNGRLIPARLPEIKDSGLVIKLSDTDTATDRILVDLTVSENLSGGIFRSVLHCRSKLIQDRSFRFGQEQASFEIDKKTLGAGINHLTIFDGAGNPVAERLIFKKPEQTDFKLSSGQQVYNVRSRAVMSWSGVPDSLTRLSVAIVRADSLNSGADILSSLYLTSDLHGDVETPGYYFSDDSQASLRADILMLTHGWRRFETPGVRSGNTRQYRFLPELKSHLVTARLLDESGNPVPGKTAYLSSPGKVIRLYTAMSDSLGRLFFEVKPGMQGSKLIIRPGQTDSLLQVVAENPFSERFVTRKPSVLKLSGSMTAGLTQRSIDMQVQDIFREQETFFTSPPVRQDTVAFYGSPDEKYLLDDYVRFPSLEEVMREFVKGVWVRKKSENFRLTVLNKDVNRMFDNSPVLLVDGVPVGDANRLFEVDALRIRQIDVMTRKFFTGPLVSEGLISLRSYAGDMAGLNPDKGSAVIDLSGLEEKRIFHAPAYGSALSREGRLPDRRRVLYFNHHLTAGPGSGNQEFYTSDVEGTYYIIVNGLTPAGTPLTAAAGFRVSR